MRTGFELFPWGEKVYPPGMPRGKSRKYAQASLLDRSCFIGIECAYIVHFTVLKDLINIIFTHLAVCIPCILTNGKQHQVVYQLYLRRRMTPCPVPLDRCMPSPFSGEAMTPISVRIHHSTKSQPARSPKREHRLHACFSGSDLSPLL